MCVFIRIRRPRRSTLFPYATLYRSEESGLAKWKVSSAKSNLLVLGGRDRKIKGSWTDVKAGEVKDLGKKLLLASKPKP